MTWKKQNDTYRLQQAIIALSFSTKPDKTVSFFYTIAHILALPEQNLLFQSLETHIKRQAPVTILWSEGFGDT